MDINDSNDIDKNEFIDFMMKAVKNFEENIEFQANDI